MKLPQALTRIDALIADNQKLAADCISLHAENAELRRDAGRYRWLRDHWHGFEYLRNSKYVSVDSEVDKQIAIAASKQEKE